MMGIGVGVIMTGIQYQKYQAVIRTGLINVLLPHAHQNVRKHYLSLRN